MPTKILIRLDSLAQPRAGIGYYTENLVRMLARDPRIELQGLWRGKRVTGAALAALLDESEAPPAKGADRLLVRTALAIKSVARAIPGVYAPRHGWRDWQDQRSAGRFSFDLYHEPTYAPFRTRAPLIVTIFDLSHRRFPQFHPRERVRYLDARLPAVIDRADHIITISDFTRSELAELFPGSERKTTAIPLGVSDHFQPRSAAETAPLLARWDLSHKGYLLSAATLEPRKNLAGLVRAYRALPAPLARDIPLVLAGGDGWKNRELSQLLSETGELPGRIVTTGRLSRSELALLMAGARLLAYPSFYEGFGLPIAEAEACGVPVLTTDRGAMREVAGEQAFLVDPDDFVDELREALLASDTELARRASPRRRTWETTAQRTVEVYLQVAN